MNATLLSLYRLEDFRLEQTGRPRAQQITSLRLLLLLLEPTDL